MSDKTSRDFPKNFEELSVVYEEINNDLNGLMIKRYYGNEISETDHNRLATKIYSTYTTEFLTILDEFKSTYPEKTSVLEKIRRDAKILGASIENLEDRRVYVNDYLDLNRTVIFFYRNIPNQITPYDVRKKVQTLNQITHN